MKVRDKISIGIAAIALGSGVAIGFATSSANAQTNYVPRGVTVYLGTFIAGPTSTEFTLIDNTRSPEVKYTCAFAGINQSTHAPIIRCSKI